MFCRSPQDDASGVATPAVTLLRGKDRQSARLLDEDRWNFHIGRFDRYVDYWLTLAPADAVAVSADSATSPGDRYFLKVELEGPALTAPPDRRTSRGVITLRKSWREPGL